MSYMQLLFMVYRNPAQFADELKSKPAPRWGFAAALQRALMDSLFIYLPVYFLGRIPHTASNLSFISTENYYGALVIIAPPVLLTIWLTSSSVIHLILKLSGKKSDFDQILNINGFTALAIGSVIIVWDLFWIIAGGVDQYFLGISHLVIDIWSVVITTIALNRILGTPVWLGVVLSFVGLAISLPFAVMFMRSPL